MSIVLKDINYTYMRGTPFERKALADVSLTIEEGSFTALAGHTGSGKSTLVQHINGLLQPDSGTVLVDGVDIGRKGAEVKRARHSVGMVFQYPEHQLFEETVAKDVAFGPERLGLSAPEVEECVRMALDFVGLPVDRFGSRSPFALSGGERRRAAIAGVLALAPRYLVLDEPTAGLDPRASAALLAHLCELHEKAGMTIVLVSHNMDDIAHHADHLIVMHAGRTTLQGSPREVFFAKEKLAEAGLRPPHLVELLEELRERGLDLDPAAFDTAEGAARIKEALGRRGSC